MATEVRKVIINLYKDGHNLRYIGQKFSKSHTAVRKVIVAYVNEHRLCAKKRPERPKITSDRVDRRILEISEANPLTSVPKIRSQLLNEGKEAPSTFTIRNRLRASGKHGRMARKIPYVSKFNIKKRMQFYVQRVLKPRAFWYNILWI